MSEQEGQSDPYDWNVEDVVACLCDAQSPIRREYSTLSFPDSQSFAATLRLHDVSGLALLREVDKAALKDEFQIRSMGHRASILEVIEALRAASAKYHRSITSRHWQHGSPLASVHGSQYVLPTSENQRYRQSLSPWPIKSEESPIASHLRGSPLAALYGNGERSRTRRWPEVTSPVPSTRVHDLSQEILPVQRPKKRLVPTNIRPLDLSRPENFTNTIQQDEAQTREEVTINSDSPASAEPSLAGTSPVVATNDPCPPADLALDESSALTRPGIMHRDDHGRKRLIPICTEPLAVSNGLSSSIPNPSQCEDRMLQPAPSNSSALDPGTHGQSNASGRRILRRPDQSYIGPQALPVDEVIFGSTEMGSTVTHDAEDGDVEFGFVGNSERSKARSLYTNNLMKYFLRQEPFDLSSSGSEKMLAKLPYKETLKPAPYPTSFLTISRVSESEFVAQRQNRRGIALADSHPNKSQFDATNSLKSYVADNISEDAEWKALEKWKYMAEPDLELPLYGQSESDGEYDSETWKEMDLEEGQAHGQSSVAEKGKLRMPNSVANVIIDQAIQSMTDKWKEKMLPKLTARAYRSWTKARRESSFLSDRLDRDREMENLGVRLAKMRNEMLAAGYSSEKKLLRSCGSLEPTVQDMNTCEWWQNLLRLQEAPARPANPAPSLDTSRKSAEPSEQFKPAVEDEKTASSEGESHDEDGSLGGFIVDDEPDASVPLENLSSQHEVESAESTSLQKCYPEDQSLEATTCQEANKETDQAPLVASPKAEPAGEQANAIDLTLSTDAEASNNMADRNVGQRKECVNIMSSDGDDGIDVWEIPQPRPAFRIPPGTPQATNAVAIVDSTSDEPSPSFSRKRLTKPSLDDVEAVFKMDPLDLVTALDRPRLLVRIIRATPKERRDEVIDAVKHCSIEQIRDYTGLGLHAFKKYRQSLRGFDKKRSDGAMQLAVWFITYTIPLTPSNEGFAVDDLVTALGHLDQFGVFYRLMIDALKYYDDRPSTTMKVEDTTKPPSTPPSTQNDTNSNKRKDKSVSNGPKKAKRRRIHRDNGNSQIDTPGARKQRVYEVEVSQKTLDMRKEAHERVERDRERRRLELNTMTNLYPHERSPSEVIVNPGKRVSEDTLKLDPGFGNGLNLKSHQVDGLQFLWRELTANHDEPAGCLLAQPMGLGKTAQIVALLVALGQARVSQREEMRCQLPQHLQRGWTMILSPPSLIANWEDELLKWGPASKKDIVGKIAKVTSGMHMAHRMIELQAWSRAGGVLLIPYSIFTAMVTNRHGSKPVFTEDTYPQYRRILINDATLIIADEAHAFKGPNTATRIAVNQIATKSRVAITGSPLSNNLLEYYELLDWVAKGYLGTSAEFRSQFEEPITTGLSQYALPGEHRLAMRRLKSLQIDLEPKVHRADFAILHEQLHGKEEFLIRLPIVKLQADLYRLFVELITSSLRAAKSLTSTFAYLNYLKLICIHPKLYTDWLTDAKRQMEAESTESSVKDAAGSPDPSCDDSTLTKDELDDEPDLSQLGSAKRNIIERSQELLAGLPLIDDPKLSNKIMVAVEIVRLSLVAGDKVLIFSHRPGALDFLSKILTDLIPKGLNLKLSKLIGSTKTAERQQITQNFNEGDANVCTIATRSGGVGLNFFGANRVIVMDEWFNPMLEQQAIGRSYRIGQRKKVFVYRLATAGTYEDALQQQSLFKTQLAARVVDQKHLIRSGSKTLGTYMFAPREDAASDISEYFGRDPEVLDKVMRSLRSSILSMKSIESFQKEDDVRLTELEEQLAKNEQLYFRNPAKYEEMLKRGEISHPIEPWTRNPTPSNGTQSTPSSSAPAIVATMRPMPQSPLTSLVPANWAKFRLGTSVAPTSNTPPVPADQGKTPESQPGGVTINAMQAARPDAAAGASSNAGQVQQTSPEVSATQA